MAIPFLITAIALLCSCSNSNSNLLKGTWNCVSLEMSSRDPETGKMVSIDYLKVSQCDKPNTLSYTFADSTLIEKDFFSCEASQYEGTYKWLNEEKDLELTQGQRVTQLHIVTLTKDSLMMTAGSGETPVMIKMVRSK